MKLKTLNQIQGVLVTANRNDLAKELVISTRRIALPPDVRAKKVLKEAKERKQNCNLGTAEKSLKKEEKTLTEKLKTIQKDLKSVGTKYKSLEANASKAIKLAKGDNLKKGATKAWAAVDKLWIFCGRP